MASSNFDRRFDERLGHLHRPVLVRSPDGRSLPPPGRAIAAPPDGGSDQGRPVQFTQLGTDGGSIVTMTDDFAGSPRWTIAREPAVPPHPVRREDDQLVVLDITPPPTAVRR